MSGGAPGEEHDRGRCAECLAKAKARVEPKRSLRSAAKPVVLRAGQIWRDGCGVEHRLAYEVAGGVRDLVGGVRDTSTIPAWVTEDGLVVTVAVLRHRGSVVDQALAPDGVMLPDAEGLDRLVPYTRAQLADWRSRLERELPCGHTLADLVAGADTVTFCGACADVRRRRREGQPKPRVSLMRFDRRHSFAWIQDEIGRTSMALIARGAADARSVDVRIEVVDVPEGAA